MGVTVVEQAQQAKKSLEAQIEAAVSHFSILARDLTFPKNRGNLDHIVLPYYSSNQCINNAGGKLRFQYKEEEGGLGRTQQNNSPLAQLLRKLEQYGHLTPPASKKELQVAINNLLKAAPNKASLERRIQLIKSAVESVGLIAGVSTDANKYEQALKDSNLYWNDVKKISAQLLEINSLETAPPAKRQSNAKTSALKVDPSSPTSTETEEFIAEEPPSPVTTVVSEPRTPMAEKKLQMQAFSSAQFMAAIRKASDIEPSQKKSFETGSTYKDNTDLLRASRKKLAFLHFKAGYFDDAGTYEPNPEQRRAKLKQEIKMDLKRVNDKIAKGGMNEHETKLAHEEKEQLELLKLEFRIEEAAANYGYGEVYEQKYNDLQSGYQEAMGDYYEIESAEGEDNTYEQEEENQATYGL